jgi:hypothetical protein
MSDKAMYGYLAGIVDGEGTITICRSENDVLRKKEYPTKDGIRTCEYRYTGIGFHVKVSVKNTDIRLMKWLQSRFGGEYYGSDNAKNPTWKTSFVWHHAAKSKEEFILAILPYLIIKREQALVALDFLRLGSVRVPEKRQALYEKIVALNQRGKPVETNTQDSSEDEMRESVLNGDIKSAPTVTLEA